MRAAKPDLNEALKEGSKAPAFSLTSNEGKTVSLADYKDKNRVVLYFYPEDDTPGCTAQACGFRDNYDNVLSHNAIVLGISPDDIHSHRQRFGWNPGSRIPPTGYT